MMKRFLSFLLMLALLMPVALADIDLSGLTFEELAALRDQIQLEMMTRDEWQEVTVPQGLWEVGVDIPAGTWTVKCADTDRNSFDMGLCLIVWGIGKPDYHGDWEYKKRKGYAFISNPNNTKTDEGSTSEVILELAVGDFVSIDKNYNKAVFFPYHGKPSLGFK